MAYVDFLRALLWLRDNVSTLGIFRSPQCLKSILRFAPIRRLQQLVVQEMCELVPRTYLLDLPVGETRMLAVNVQKY